MPAEPARPSFLVDVNVLIALTWTGHVHHGRAHQWFAGVTDWATTPFTEVAFLRLSTTRAVVGRDVSMPLALEALGRIRELPGHRFIPDTASPAAPAIDISRVATAAQTTDAHLVDLAAASGAILATLDTHIEDFLAPEDRRFVLVIE